MNIKGGVHYVSHWNLHTAMVANNFDSHLIEWIEKFGTNQTI
jgi:hypothetical protein